MFHAADVTEPSVFQKARATRRFEMNIQKRNQIELIMGALALLSVTLLANAGSVVSKVSPKGRMRFGATGIIFGYQFEDLNGNGIDDGDPRLSGVHFDLFGIDDPSISLSVQTDENGEFVFSGLPFQRYRVCEAGGSSYEPATPECVEVPLFGKRLQVLGQGHFDSGRRADSHYHYIWN
jgi:hypothetical protein